MKKINRIVKLAVLVLFFCLVSTLAHAANTPPQIGTITPSSGTSGCGEAVSLTTTYSDADGWQNIQYAYLLVNTSTSTSNCFYGRYNQNTNKLYLYVGGLTSWAGGYAPGSSNIIETSYVKLDCSQTTVQGQGSTLTITWRIIFKPAFLGAKNAYLNVTDDSNSSSGLIQKGTWTIQKTDTTPPSGTISINNNAEYTNSNKVTLTLSATDTQSAVTQMQFSNNNNTWSSPEAYASTKTWSMTTSNGTKTVYVKYKDEADNWSSHVSDTIILDSTPPTGTIAINNNVSSTTSTQVVLNLSAIDRDLGVDKMIFSNDNANWSSPEAYSTTRTWGLSSGTGQKTVYVKFSDKAGNWSRIYSDSILLDNPPAITAINPNSNTSFTELDAVTFTVIAADIDSDPLKYQFSVDGQVKQSWDSKSSFIWQTQSGDNGAHIILVEVGDGYLTASQKTEIYLWRKPIDVPEPL